MIIALNIDGLSINGVVDAIVAGIETIIRTVVKFTPFEPTQSATLLAIPIAVPIIVEANVKIGYLCVGVECINLATGGREDRGDEVGRGDNECEERRNAGLNIETHDSSLMMNVGWLARCQ